MNAGPPPTTRVSIFLRSQSARAVVITSRPDEVLTGPPFEEQICQT
jgi:hypothetical protein